MKVEVDENGFTLVHESEEELQWLHDARFRGVDHTQLLNLRPRKETPGRPTPCDGLRVNLRPPPF